MKIVVKVDYSENTKAVLANTKLEVEYDSIDEYNTHRDAFKRESKELFEDAQAYALKQTLKRM